MESKSQLWEAKNKEEEIFNAPQDQATSVLAGRCILCKISSISVARAQFAVLKSKSRLPTSSSSGTSFSVSFFSGFLTEFLPVQG